MPMLSPSMAASPISVSLFCAQPILRNAAGAYLFKRGLRSAKFRVAALISFGIVVYVAFILVDAFFTRHLFERARSG